MALSANFIADFSSFMDATRDATAAMGGFKDSAADVGPAADRSLAALQQQAAAVGGAVRQVGIDVVAASAGFIQAFTEEQDAVNQLNTALTNTGNATPAVTDAYAAMAAQFQATTKYADEAVIAVQATLTTVGKVGPENMELALAAVTNLASGLKIDLTTAATMVAKAIGSGGESLGKLKVIMGDTIEPGMATADMLGEINKKFGSAAANELNTYNGQMEHMNNTISDFNEKIGGVLVELLSKVMNAFTALPESVQTVTIAVVAIGAAIAPVLVSLSSLVSIVGATGIGAGLISAFTAILTFIGPAGWITLAVGALAVLIYKNWDGIVAYTQKLYEGIKTWLVDGFGAIVASMKAKADAVIGFFRNMWAAVVGHSYVPDMVEGIRSEFGDLDAAMVQPAEAATAQTIRAYAELMQYTNRANAILRQNPFWTTPTQLEQIANLPLPGSGGGGGSVTVNNTFNLVDTESNLARRVSEEIMRTIRAGTQLGTA